MKLRMHTNHKFYIMKTKLLAIAAMVLLAVGLSAQETQTVKQEVKKDAKAAGTTVKKGANSVATGTKKGAK